MLTANLWIKAGLVNRSMGIIQDILFEKQGLSAFPKAVFVKFEKYNGPNITTMEGVEVIPIVPIKCSWKDKNGIICS